MHHLQRGKIVAGPIPRIRILRLTSRTRLPSSMLAINPQEIPRSSRLQHVLCHIVVPTIDEIPVHAVPIAHLSARQLQRWWSTPALRDNSAHIVSN